MQGFLGIGSNIGDRLDYLKKAIQEIQNSDIQIIKCSSVYETSPWGYTQQPNFYNCVIAIKTNKVAVGELLTVCQAIENKFLRKRIFRYGPRTLDIDILSVGIIQIQTPELIIPHPKISERLFVLKPWAEIAPDFLLPNSTQTIQELLRQLPEEEPMPIISTLELKQH